MHECEFGMNDAIKQSLSILFGFFILISLLYQLSTNMWMFARNYYVSFSRALSLFFHICTNVIYSVTFAVLLVRFACMCAVCTNKNDSFYEIRIIFCVFALNHKKKYVNKYYATVGDTYARSTYKSINIQQYDVRVHISKVILMAKVFFCVARKTYQ